jgi:putative hydrolase of the HAD superfamily
VGNCEAIGLAPAKQREGAHFGGSRGYGCNRPVPYNGGVIQAVFFDFDGVLTRDRTGTLTTCRYLSGQTGIPLERWVAAFEPHRAALARGQTTRDATWPLVCEAVGRDVPREVLTRAFESTPLDPAMFAFANSLARHGKVGIVTDNPKDRMDVVRRTLWLDRVFAPIVVSAEEGRAKDDPMLFRHAVVAAGVAPADAVFIDNVMDNVEVARTVGLHGVHFDDEKRDLAALARELLALGVH